MTSTLPYGSGNSYGQDRGTQQLPLERSQGTQRGGPNRRGRKNGSESYGCVSLMGGHGASFGGGFSVLCNCGEQAIVRKVHKEGLNTGREFYTCSKPRDQQCKFFEWADNYPSSNTQRYSTRGGRGIEKGGNSWRKTHEMTDTDLRVRKRAAPTCSVCQEKGHTKRSCPLSR